MSPETLLHRQVHPAFVQKDRVTSQAFKPTPKDEQKLSVYDGDQITAKASWHHFTQQGYDAEGVLSVSFAECTFLRLEPYPHPKPFKEHVLIDFTALSQNQTEKAAKQLRKKASERGWQFRR